MGESVIGWAIHKSLSVELSWQHVKWSMWHGELFSVSSNWVVYFWSYRNSFQHNVISTKGVKNELCLFIHFYTISACFRQTQCQSLCRITWVKFWAICHGRFFWGNSWLVGAGLRGNWWLTVVRLCVQLFLPVQVSRHSLSHSLPRPGQSLMRTSLTCTTCSRTSRSKWSSRCWKQTAATKTRPLTTCCRCSRNPDATRTPYATYDFRRCRNHLLATTLLQ